MASHNCFLPGRLLLLLAAMSIYGYAGGPAYVAGNSTFDPGVKGTPLTWAQGAINYYTDQGDLSSQLPGSAADAFVADAFSRWTSIATAAVSSTRAGQLGEDVSGANVFLNADGSISMPPDILPGATSQPVAVVYDNGGQVTDALLGQGAGGADLCFTNAVFGGTDNFGSDGRFTHALVVLNGNCAATAAQLPDVKYRLVRVLGRVLGLGWSQTNINPAPQDYGGFTIMHSVDALSCVPITVCYTSPDVPKMDDRAALSRLYPVTAQNRASFPGKQIFHDNTVHFSGSVRFVDANGQPTQPMQGVNVVARWIDPSTRSASSTYVASSVSGFLFSGNAGNPATGFNDSLGQPLDRFGSDDPSLEGFFDLGGLEIPDGSPSAAYQITVEPVDPMQSTTVGPYQPWQVLPSGSPFPMTVTIAKGGDFQQDILMQSSAVGTPDWFGPQSFVSPVLVPTGGDWTGTLSGYGDVNYFRLTGQANRSLSVEVTALDATGAPSENKARPVIGIWSLANPDTPAPVATPDAFNTSTTGMSQLNVNLLSSTEFRIGVADSRGDGRPDFRYHARVFYADTVIPARASARGGTTLAVRGSGFRSNTQASISGLKSTVLAASADQVVMNTPPMEDGPQNITLNDPATGATSVMTEVVTYGAGANDILQLLAGSNPSTAVGGEAPNPIRVQVLGPNGVTPVTGASVFLTSSPAASISICGNAASCTVFSDESGEVSTRITPLSVGTTTITAQLAPASYNPPQQVQAPVAATSSALDLSLSSPSLWIAQGATLDIPLAAKVLANGMSPAGRTVNYSVTQGSGTLSSASAPTNASGTAIITLHLPALASEVDVSACVSPQNSPCKIFHFFPIAPASIRLEAVSKSLQFIATGQSFLPVTVRAFDSGTGNPVRGASVAFQLEIGRAPGGDPVVSIGDTTIKHNPLPIILASSKTTVLSDTNGLATIQPSSAGIPGAVVIQGTATSGVASLPFAAQSLGR
jgi:hypothetical protein